MGTSRRGLAAVALAGMLASVLVGGCQSLFGMGGPYGPLDPGCAGGFVPPTSFTTGSATLTFATGQPRKVALGMLDGTPSMFDGSCGTAMATWTDATGTWSLMLFTSSDGGPAPSGLFLTSRVDGQDRYADGTTCSVTVEEVSAKGLAGHASCKGLTWASDNEQPASPPPGSGPAPFDVTITFEARP